MTIKFEYTDDSDGRKKEAESYIVSDFVTVATASSPVITLPDGTLDPSLIPPIANAKAVKVTITRKATGTILTGDSVSPTSVNHVGIGDSNTTKSDATILGIALNDATAEEDVEVLVFGVDTDPAFSVFSVNDILFQDEAGGITNIRPSAPSRKYLTIVGKSLGGDDIFINVQPPVTLA